MRTIILGGGISGLSAAWFLLKKEPSAKITLLEKEARVGGWIKTKKEGGFEFELGPRTLSYARSPHLLALIEELGLASEIIPSLPAANRRFLYTNGQLRSTGSFWPSLLKGALVDLITKRKCLEDESIYDFASRRFGVYAAETFFDPMTLGIYAGDIRKLSIRSCFPSLQEWEQKEGSVLRGLWKKKKQKPGLFTLRGGLERIIEELKKQLPIKIVRNCNVESIDSEIEEFFPEKGRDSPTAKGRQVYGLNQTDSSANSALKGRDCARAAVEEFFPEKGRDSPTAKGRQVYGLSQTDSSANSALKGRDCARAAVEEFFPEKGRDSPTAKGRQVYGLNQTDSSANSALKGRDCARAAVEEFFPEKGRDSPTAKGRQVPCLSQTDSSANSALKGRDCARAAVHTSKGTFPADRIISALPAHEISRLTQIPLDIPYRSLWVVHIGFSTALLMQKGFGYLVPSKENQPLLGMVWDSQIFAEESQTRLTALIRGTSNDPEGDALKALRSHLHISDPPTLLSASFANQAIPQFEVGHHQKIASFKTQVQHKYPRITLTGSYLQGPSLESCIQTSDLCSNCFN